MVAHSLITKFTSLMPEMAVPRKINILVCLIKKKKKDYFSVRCALID